MPSGVERKLTTILAADAEGYSRLMDTDEVGGIGALRQARDVFTRQIDQHGGRIANTAGDGLIAEFPSVVEAVQCAIDVQRELAERNDGNGAALHFRIGVHLGDVIVEGGDLLGEGVNLAARLQTMAEPGGILISRQVHEQIQNKVSIGFEYLGERRVKNFTRDVGVYRVELGGSGVGARRHSGRRPAPRDTVDDAGPAPGHLRQRLMRHAAVFAGLWLLLLIVNLVTDGRFWAHWPGLAMAGILGLEAAPLYASGWFSVQVVRGGVIVTVLVLINLFTWSGYPWALWPAGAFVAAALLRRLGPRTR